MAASMDGFAIPLCMTYIFFIFIVSSAADTISEMQSVKDGETIVSSGGSFEMGFFSPGNSKDRYVGIWYKKINVTTVVWVANREIPLTETSGVLKVTPPGILVLLNGTNEIIWSSNTSRSVKNPVAQLLETGNLVVKKVDDDSVENILWQSFDYPGNTLLPDMKLGKNLLTGQEWCISSWKSDDDPSQGEYTYRMDTNGYPELVMRSGNIVMYRSGPWNGLRFSGSPSSNPNNFFNYSVVFNEEEVYYSYSVLNKSVAFRRVLSHLGVVQRWTWAEPNGPWILYSSSPTEYCDRYAPCGVYSSCKKNNSPICKCLDKFLPRYPRDWSAGDWSDGCIRKKPFVCRRGDGFLKYTGLNSPDTSNSWYSINMTLEECMRMCSENCSCVAYSNLDMRGKRSGCLLWFDNLIDIKDVGEDGQDIYVRMASSELEVESHVGADKKREEKIIVISALIGTILIFLCLTFYICKKRRQLKERGLSGLIFPRSDSSGSRDKDLSLPLFGLDKIVKATNNFSMGNKLGEGGYGPVYKGILQGGQDIAVKRLSRDSRQGLEEFKNEVIFIAKLQHRNLVKLLGCCIQGEERMLIYEYMPNKSLDSFIFDKTKCALLDWPIRFHIINGISRGLLYLHQDSRLRIIHRDLKTSNILLDIDMNPKISDFGLARSFGANETEANTSKVVGTYGYMSPEYAAHGIFSVKSDVFSFGVLVLEIISGKKNISSFLTDDTFNLLGHAWKLHRDGRSMELVDDSIITLCHLSEMLRSIHVALLCVQECRNDRPTMASVVLMLNSDNTLPHPKQPGFFNDKDCLQSKSSTNRDTRSSVNEITITQLLDGR